MSCPFLSYRTTGDGHEFDVARAYCTATDAFVQPMRADVCNDRFALDHATDCEIFLAHADDRNERGSTPDGDSGASP